MEAMVREWTDGRLDELSGKVDRGFEQVDQRFDRVESEVRGLRLEMRTELTAMRSEMDGMRGEMTKRLDGVQRVMVFGFISMTAAILTGFAALVSTQV
jgi:hypothetical protein